MSDLPRELGDFILQELIGTGGMGEVYRGVQKSLDRDVAVKLLRDEYARDENFIVRFKREAKSAAKLIHPNIIQVYQLGDQDGEYYFAMEYVKGDDLQQILQRRSEKLPVKEVFKIIYGVAKALEIAFKYSIVHRDIKPSNILITLDNEIKVMDFGLAKAFEGAETDITISGAIMGTANYMSPEQAEGKAVDQRTDLYSMGVMFYQLLTGFLPFTGDNPTSLAFQHVHSAPTPPMEKIDGISNELNGICLKLLAKKKEDRYQNATEFLKDLQGMMDDSSSSYDFAEKNMTHSEDLTASLSEEKMVASNEATIDSTLGGSVDENKTLAPGMMEPTRLDSPTVMAESVASTMAPGATVLKMQEVSAESTKLEKSEASGKSSNGLMMAIVVLLLVGAGYFVVTEVLVTKAPAVIGESSGDSGESVTDDKTRGIASKNTLLAGGSSDLVNVDLKPLKKLLANGFNICLAEKLDESALKDRIALDDIDSLQSLSGNKKLELSHEYYKPLVINVVVGSDGEIDLEGFRNPDIDLDKLVNRIGSFFLSGRLEELKKLLDYGVPKKETALINDRVRIIKLEVTSRELFKNPTQDHLVKSYGLLVAEKLLSIDGNKLLKAIKAEASKDKKLSIMKGVLQVVQETSIKNSLGMIFKIISPGEFMMGSSVDKKYLRRTVKISKKFALLKYEVTNGDYRKLYVALNKRDHKTGGRVHTSSTYLNKDLNGDLQPVVSISWVQAKLFCDHLTSLEKGTGRVYRLPTEAEWEYCAKANTSNEYSWGVAAKGFKGQANLLDAGSTADIALSSRRFKGNDKFVVSAPVGQYAPNAFGLYDLGGNVKEWVSDYYVKGCGIKEGAVDPKGPTDTGERCVRGASYLSGVKKGRITYRRGKHEEANSYEIGFRVVLEINSK